MEREELILLLNRIDELPHAEATYDNVPEFLTENRPHVSIETSGYFCFDGYPTNMEIEMVVQRGKYYYDITSFIEDEELFGERALIDSSVGKELAKHVSCNLD